MCLLLRPCALYRRCTSLGEVKCKKEIWSQNQTVIRNCQVHNSEISVRREGRDAPYSVEFKSECGWEEVCVSEMQESEYQDVCYDTLS